MGIKKLTFNGENNTAEQASKIHLALQTSHSGILEGVGDECDFVFANNTITFKSGFVSVYGRIIEIEDGTTISLEADSNFYGYVILYVNTYDNTVSLQLKESASIPSLQQENISLSQGVFELPLLKYHKTLTVVTILSNTEKLEIKSISTLKNEWKSEVEQYISDNGTKEVVRTDRFGASHYFDLDLNETGEILLMMSIEDTVERIFSSNVISYGPGTGVGYHLNGDWYLAEMIRYENRITITTAESLHEVTQLWIIR